MFKDYCAGGVGALFGVVGLLWLNDYLHTGYFVTKGGRIVSDEAPLYIAPLLLFSAASIAVSIGQWCKRRKMNMP